MPASVRVMKRPVLTCVVLPESVEAKLSDIFASGACKREDVDHRCLEQLRSLPEQAALEVVQVIEPPLLLLPSLPLFHSLHRPFLSPGAPHPPVFFPPFSLFSRSLPFASLPYSPLFPAPPTSNSIGPHIPLPHSLSSPPFPSASLPLFVLSTRLFFCNPSSSHLPAVQVLMYGYGANRSFPRRISPVSTG